MNNDQTIAEREHEARSSRKALNEAEARLQSAKDALAGDPSDANVDAAEKAERVRARAALLNEAHERRLGEARAEQSANRRRADQAAFDDAERRASPDAFIAQMRPMIDQLVELERNVGKVIEDAVTVLMVQQTGAKESKGLSAKVGALPRWRPIKVEVARAVVQLEIEAARRRDGRRDAAVAGDWLAPRRLRVQAAAEPNPMLEAEITRDAAALLNRAAAIPAAPPNKPDDFAGDDRRFIPFFTPNPEPTS